MATENKAADSATCEGGPREAPPPQTQSRESVGKIEPYGGALRRDAFYNPEHGVHSAFAANAVLHAVGARVVVAQARHIAQAASCEKPKSSPNYSDLISVQI